ncbi:MAG: tyrosine-type recombinase/integrase [Verrucomicrobiota bacterium]
MKVIRKEYPRVRCCFQHGKTRYQVDLRKKNYLGQQFKGFSSRDKALEFAQRIGSKVSIGGLDAISNIIEDARIRSWQEQLSVYGKSLEQAMQVALDQFSKEFDAKESLSVSGLMSIWFDDRKVDKLKPIRPRSLDTLRKMSNMFKVDFADTKIAEMDQARIETYLESKEVGNVMRKNIKSYLGQFFNWSIVKKYHNENPCKHIKISIKQVAVKLFTAEQCNAIMTEALQHKDITAYFALALFGGVRPEEIDKMNWDTNIKMNSREVFIQSDISKTKKDRMFKMSDTLYEWLNYCRENSNLLVPTFNIRNRKSEVWKKLPFPWIQDGMRHSFASYHYAKFHSLDDLRWIMGNSPGIIERCYKGIIPEEEISKFWSILPPKE